MTLVGRGQIRKLKKKYLQFLGLLGVRKLILAAIRSIARGEHRVGYLR
jgi:hypothetical protein